MSNQNIYSNQLSGYVSINRDIISKLGLNERPFLRTVYILLVERTNWETGIVYFSSRFAQESLEIGQKKHQKIIDDLTNLGLIEVLNTVKGESTKLRVIHYTQVINGVKKTLDEPVNIKTIEEQILKAEIETPEPKCTPVISFINNKDKDVYELFNDEDEKLLNEYFNVRGGFSNKRDALNNIRRQISTTKETFNEHCNRIIKMHTPSLYEII